MVWPAKLNDVFLCSLTSAVVAAWQLAQDEYVTMSVELFSGWTNILN